MSIYKTLSDIASKYFSKHLLFKYGFNFSPMYRRSTGRIAEVSKDLLTIKVIVPLNYKNINYVNSMFGGSMFSSVDPIPMVQLIYIIGDDYVVWDKSAQIAFKRPAKENLYADFRYTLDEIEDIKNRVKDENEIEILKSTKLTNYEGDIVYCEVIKTIYIADKAFYKKKRRKTKK